MLDKNSKPYRPQAKPRVAPKTYQVAGAQHSNSMGYTGSKMEPSGVNRKARVSGSSSGSQGSMRKPGYSSNMNVSGSFKSAVKGKYTYRTSYKKKNNSAMSAPTSTAGGSDTETSFPH